MMHKYSHPKVPVSVVGARGYSGLELARLLLDHPAADFAACFGTRDFDLGQELFHAKANSVKSFNQDQILERLTDIVFLATPAEVSAELAPQILARGKKVIDLSGAFRLKQYETAKWYGFEHADKHWLEGAEYGLVPFCGPAASTNLIANPGCYATAVGLALIPLLQADLIEPTGLVIDAKSGTTGAGRRAGENLLFSEVDGECLPYRVGCHQHLPEIQETVLRLTGKKIDPHFVTHLLPAKRGIVASVFATSKTKRIEDIAKAFEDAYGHYPLVRHGSCVERLARLSGVVGTPFAQISYTLVGQKLYVFSVLDNLLKGAASQAVENFNRLLDLPLAFSLHGRE